MSERDNKPKKDAAERGEPTPAEAADAARLRDALEGRGEAPSDSADLAFALRAAWSPASLADETLREMLDDVPTSAEELSEASAFAAIVGTKQEPEVVAALRAAWNPSELPETEHEALLRTVTAPPPARVLRFPGIRRVAAFATTALAAAAAIAVWLGSAPSSEVPLARVRSTTSLFDVPFGEGEGSARIDRIAVARAADYRDNRFAQWGLR